MSPMNHLISSGVFEYTYAIVSNVKDKTFLFSRFPPCFPDYDNKKSFVTARALISSKREVHLSLRAHGSLTQPNLGCLSLFIKEQIMTIFQCLVRPASGLLRQNPTTDLSESSVCI